MIRSGLMGAILILRKGLGFGRVRIHATLDAVGGARAAVAVSWTPKAVPGGGTIKRWPVCRGGRFARLLGLLGLGFVGLGFVGSRVHGPRL